MDLGRKDYGQAAILRLYVTRTHTMAPGRTLASCGPNACVRVRLAWRGLPPISANAGTQRHAGAV